jgi:hypothetical protein
MNWIAQAQRVVVGLGTLTIIALGLGLTDGSSVAMN